MSGRGKGGRGLGKGGVSRFVSPGYAMIPEYMDVYLGTDDGAIEVPHVNDRQGWEDLFERGNAELGEKANQRGESYLKNLRRKLVAGKLALYELVENDPNDPDFWNKSSYKRINNAKTKATARGAKSKSNAKAKSNANSKAKSKSNAKAKSKSNAKAKSNAEANSKAKSNAEADSKAKAKAKAKPTSNKPKPNPQPGAAAPGPKAKKGVPEHCSIAGFELSTNPSSEAGRLLRGCGK